MDTVAERAHRVLARQPTPALSVRELHRLMSGELGGPSPPRELFLHQLRRRPDLFRVLRPWRGPWSGLVAPESGRPGAPPVVTDLQVDSGAWVVPTGGSGPPEGEPDSATRTLRATLLAVGRDVDEGSLLALTRWMGMVREGRRVRRWISRRRSARAVGE